MDIIVALTSKDDKYACALADKIIAESQKTNEWYQYFDDFASLLNHPKSLVRNRVLYILAANIQWDDENRFDLIITEFLSHITDEKPITSRQCIKALIQIGQTKREYIPRIISALHSADLSGYKDSMRPLIEKDIVEAENILTLRRGERPALDKNLDSKTFLEFYYLKEELMDFCRKNGLPADGGKLEITKRVAFFLDSGRILPSGTRKKKVTVISSITEDTEIETDFVCSERHRSFFKEHIGNSFTFNVAFQKWLKSNSGKTYREAISAYYQILEDKKKGKTQIDRQFEYNTYIRDFFADNKGKSLEEAIKCWKYKKQLQGNNRYEQSDLAALK